MTVFVVNPIRGEDISPALKWGEFRFVNSHYVYGDELWPILTAAVDSPPQWTIPPRHMANLQAAAKTYDPDQDYVLIGGDHLQLVALVALIACRHDTVRILRYDKKISDYIPVRVQLNLDKAQAGVLASDTDIGEMNGQDGDEGVIDYEREQYLGQGGAGPTGGLDQARQQRKTIEQRRRDFLDGK